MTHDSRPRVEYRLPDGRVVPVIFDHGNECPPTVTFSTSIGGRAGVVVEAVRVGPEEACSPYSCRECYPAGPRRVALMAPRVRHYVGGGAERHVLACRVCRQRRDVDPTYRMVAAIGAERCAFCASAVAFEMDLGPVHS